MPWPLIDAAFRSVCSLAIVPMQDFMSLGTEARFNTPGTVVNNWIWQLDWNLCKKELSRIIADSVRQHGRWAPPMSLTVF